MNSISITELLMLSNRNIIDIRNNYYYNFGHIIGAINIPYYDLLTNHSHYLNKYSIYYLYCDTGDQSKEISIRLNSFGYKTINIVGGYEEYLRIFNHWQESNSCLFS